MNKKLILAGALVLGLATVASAQEGTVNGAAGGAVTGAIVGGPVGAAVGGVAGAVVGTVLAPPPRKVVSYVEQQPIPEDEVVVREKVVVGQPLPETVRVVPIPDEPKYSYAVVNKQRVIVNPSNRTVVRVVQ
jgi:outer membrane lipoprotein SlyB